MHFTTRHFRRGLSLIELLAIVATIGVLSAMAVPNALDAMARARVAAVHVDQRELSNSLKMYQVDHGALPLGRPTPGRDPVGVFAMNALAVLTTPVGYVSPKAFRDPFGPLLPTDQTRSGGSLGGPRSGRLFPFLFDQPSMLYFNYRQVAVYRANPRLAANAVAVVSSGPDRVDSFSLFRPFPDELPANAAALGIAHVSDTIYDPTNGTVSAGDIAVWVGEVSTAVR